MGRRRMLRRLRRKLKPSSALFPLKRRRMQRRMEKVTPRRMEKVIPRRMEKVIPRRMEKVIMRIGELFTIILSRMIWMKLGLKTIQTLTPPNLSKRWKMWRKVLKLNKLKRRKGSEKQSRRKELFGKRSSKKKKRENRSCKRSRRIEEKKS